MARVYTVRRTFTNPGAVNVLQLQAGAAVPFVVLGWGVEQEASESSVQMAFQLLRKSAAATVTALAAADAVKLDPGDNAAALQYGTSATGHTSSANGTDGDVLSSRGFNSLNGLDAIFIPEERPIVPGAGLIAIKNLEAFTGTVSVWIRIAENLVG